MPLTLGVLRETAPGERRVALTPEVAAKLLAGGIEILIEHDAGKAAGLPDSSYAGVAFAVAEQVLARSELLFAVAPQPERLAGLRTGAVLIGFLEPHRNHQLIARLRERRATAFAVELIPRIARAQSMDALSSQAAAAGYKAALIAADNLARFFPMLTTAAGTIRPAQVLVIGAGVAGLQAIATARRLGAVVEGYDVRSATREQIRSLGAKFVDTGVSAEGSGGYARELTGDEQARQQQVLEEHIARADALITTAAVPGKPAPRIIRAAAVERMKPGSVVIDIAAEAGGNCELTRAGETVEHHGVRIVGPMNLPSELAYHASAMYARNLFNFVQPALRDGEFALDWDDEIIATAAVIRDGEPRH